MKHQVVGVDEAELIAFAKTKLAGYKCPKKVEFREELARTATGKLQKFKLREPFWADQARQNGAATSEATTWQVAAVISQSLELRFVF